jgi:hypothetical protein
VSVRISYELLAPAPLKSAEVHEFVYQMHGHARSLPFRTMSPIFGAAEEQCAYANWRSLPDELRWMVVQNTKLVAEPFCPAEVIGFVTLPAEGSEWAAFGFCRFARGRREGCLAPACERVLDDRWHWSGWCSTRHAANLKYGGPTNFLRGHLAVIRMLEFCQKCGWLDDVRDQYGYWEQRDERECLQRAQATFADLAALAGALKDTLAGSHVVASPILEHPNFEHLEAKGRGRSRLPPEMV